ncbi:MAG: glycosyltransferase [Novosphingobium sp.]|nr:glycosyltransferase [Novosphingobium sp.]
MSDAPRRLTVVMPVYDDWESAARVIGDIAAATAASGIEVDIVAVDDGSSEPPPERLEPAPGVTRIECLALAANLGHQRAIAVGLMAVAERPGLDLVAVMDADGEDRAEDLRTLAERAAAAPGRAVVAQRGERSEGLAFKAFYWLYTRLFRLLTGQRINFGNFIVLQAGQVHRVIGNPHVWNNFPAALLQSRIAVEYVPTRRGKRYAGRSRMNFVGLVAHGLGAISVLSEAVFVRILIASLALLTLSVGLALGALYLKLFTDLALPNWATIVLGFALVISIQALMMPILMAFLLLNNRAAIQPLPASVALTQIRERRMLAG